MKIQKAVRARHAAVAHKSKYAWATYVALIAALIMSFFWAVPRVAAQGSSAPSAPSAADPDSTRYQAMVGFFEAQGIDSTSARWLAESWVLTSGTLPVPTASDPSSDRYQALVNYFEAEGIDSTSARWLADSQLLTQGAQSGSGAISADYQAMVDFYLARGIDLASAQHLAAGQVAADVRHGSVAALSRTPSP